MATACDSKENGSVMRLYIGKYMSIIILCMTLSACASSATSKTQENTVVHVVLIWLNEPGNAEHFQQVIDVTNQLKEIPDIQELRVGKAIPSDRKIVDDSFDIGLYMIFENQTSMQRYLNSPEHIEAVKTILKPLARKIRVHDFASMNEHFVRRE